MAWAVPWALYSCTVPSAATGTITRLARFSPGCRLMFDAVGGVPDGNTVRYVPVDSSVPVRFSTTAVTCVVGTPPWPVIGTVRVEFGPSGLPDRVSRTRAGFRAA